MADAPSLLYALKLKLRRKYAADLPGLRKLSDEIFAQATEIVTITSGKVVTTRLPRGPRDPACAARVAARRRTSP